MYRRPTKDTHSNRETREETFSREAQFIAQWDRMSSDSGEPLRVEESVQDKEATSCFDDRLGPDNNKMEAFDIDKTMAENRMHIPEDDRYSVLAQGDDHHEYTVESFKGSCDNRCHDIISDSCKADTQNGSDVRSVEGSNYYQCFDDLCQNKQDYLEPQDNVKLQIEDTVMRTYLESSQVHAVDALDHTNMKVQTLTTKEFEVKDEPSDECLKMEGSSFNTELIQAYSDVKTSVDADKTMDILQKSTIDENYLNSSINKHVSEISQTVDQQKNDVESRLDFIYDTSNAPVLTGTEAMTREIDKIPKHDLKIIDSNDQRDVNTVLTENLNSAKQENKSLETDTFIDLNDDKFLEEISKSLTNRDMTMYDRTFLGLEHEESAQSQHESVDSNPKISEDNQQTAIDNKVLVKIENVPDTLSTVESISETTDINKSSAISQLKITESVKLLKVEAPDISNNSDEVSLLTNLIEANTTEESSSTQKNIELQPLLKDKSNVIEIQALSNPRDHEESTDVIHKLQRMNWLKPQLASESAMARNRKMTLRSLPKKDERVEDYFEGTKKNTNNNDSKTNTNDSVQSKNQTAPALQSQHSEPTVQAIAPDQPSVWNKNTVDQLFPEAQLANVEDEQICQALAESICTAQQESERRKMAGNLKIQILDEPDDDEWGKKNYRNLPNEPSADLANHAKGLVDQYGRVDGYTEKHLFMGPGARRREQEFLKAQSENADSQASNKEMSLPSKTQQGPTNMRPQETPSQSLQVSKKDVPPQSKTQEGPANRRVQETASQSSSQVPKKDAPLPSKTQQAPASARSDKDMPKEKPGFNQGSFRGRRRGSAGKVETKSDSRSADKNQQSSRNENEKSQDKRGFSQDASRNSQQQQRGQTTNQDSKAEARGQSARQDVKAEARGHIATQDVKTEGHGQTSKQEIKIEARSQNQQRPASARYEDVSNRDKPGFNQGPVKDPYEALRKQDLVNNKSQCPGNSNNKNQDNYNRQRDNSDRYENTSKNMEPLNKNHDKDQYSRSQHQDNYNRNSSQAPARSQTQDYSNDKNKTQNGSGRNQIQDHFDRYQSQDSYNRNRGQDRSDRNQNQDNLNRNQSQQHPHRTQQQESNRNQSSSGRFQENSNNNQNLRDRNQTSTVDSSDYQNKNQSYDRYNESRNRDQDRYNRNQENGNKNQNRFQKTHSEDNWDDWESTKPKPCLENDRYNESRNKDQDRYHRYQDSGNRYQDVVNKNQDRFQTAHSEDNWNDYGSTKPKSSSQRVSDNKSQQQPGAAYNQKGYYNQESSNSISDRYKNAYLQDNRKVVVDKKVDLSKKTNTHSDNQSINAILSRSNITSSTQSNISIGSMAEAKLPLHHSTPNTTISTLVTKEIKNDYKEESPKAETVVTFSHVHESLNSEPRPNVVLAFEGNQNVQRALGLDINASPAVQSMNPQLINAAYGNSPMNVNALPFEAPSLNAQQGLNCPQLDSSIPNLPLAFSTAPNISNVESQLRMNEISNLSQDILRLHTTVVSLANKLASAQADLLVAQAKFNQLVQPDSTTSPTVQVESPPVPANFYTMQCVAPPGFTAATPTIQKVIQPDAYQLPKSYATSNVQQDFATDELHSNAAVDQRLIQQYHIYQQQQLAANFQQFSANVNANVTAPSEVSRERIVPQSQPQPQLNKGRELRGCGNQFYN